jgi:hypothetical protein
MRIVVIMLAALCLAGPARAQQNGNVYNGTSHEPAAGDVHEKERAAGLAAPAPVRQRRDEDVEKLGDQVLRQSHQTMPKDPPKPTDEPGR